MLPIQPSTQRSDRKRTTLNRERVTYDQVAHEGRTAMNDQRETSCRTRMGFVVSAGGAQKGDERQCEPYLRWAETQPVPYSGLIPRVSKRSASERPSNVRLTPVHLRVPFSARARKICRSSLAAGKKKRSSCSGQHVSIVRSLSTDRFAAAADEPTSIRIVETRTATVP